MNETETTHIETPTIADETLVIERDGTTITEAETAEQSAELQAQRVADEQKSQEEAVRISAGLKEKSEKVTVQKQKPSDRVTFFSETTKLGVTWPFGPGVEKGVRWTGYGLSGIFTAVENWGYMQLKKHQKFISDWIPFIGPWLVAKAKPAETWRQQDMKVGSKKK